MRDIPQTNYFAAYYNDGFILHRRADNAVMTTFLTATQVAELERAAEKAGKKGIVIPKEQQPIGTELQSRGTEVIYVKDEA